MIRHAANFDFEVQTASPEKKQPRLDAARNLENDDLVQKRCCLLFAESPAGVVRNRYQLVLLLLAMAALRTELPESFSI